MRICYLANSIIPSRTANSVHVMKMCSAYSGLGHEVTLVLPTHEDKVEPNVDNIFQFYGVQNRFNIVRIRPRRPLKAWYSIAFPKAAVKATRADLFHTRIAWSGWGLATLFRQPTMLELHETPVEGSLLEKSIRAVSKRRFLKKFIAITQSLSDQIGPLVFDRSKIQIAPDGVDEQLVTCRISKEEARQQIGLEEEKRRIVVYTGHLYAGRGIEIIVELARRNSDHLFLIVGGREKEIEFWKTETNDLNNLRFEGFVAPSLVNIYLRGADVLLMPYAKSISHAGGGNTAAFCSPMKMFEYMAAGRPIISSDLRVLQEVLTPEHNCLVAAFEDIDAWIENVIRLKSDRSLADRLGRQANQDAAMYTWESRSVQLLSGCFDSCNEEQGKREIVAK